MAKTPQINSPINDPNGAISRVWRDFFLALADGVNDAEANGIPEGTSIGAFIAAISEMAQRVNAEPYRQRPQEDAPLSIEHRLLNKINELEQRIEAAPVIIKSAISYPVGAVFLSVVATDPKILLGFGTWARIAEGQFLVGFLTGDANFAPAENTGGSLTATHDNNHTGAAVNDHTDHVHTGSSGHTVAPNLQGALSGNVTTDGAHDNTGGSTTTLGHTVTQPDAHSDHDIVPPFFVVYAWKRTA